MNTSGPDIFKDFLVLELAGVLAGPSAGYFFAELGARVVKVENPRTGGDITRTWKLKSEDAAKKGSAYFWSVNAGKESLYIDLSDQGARKKFYGLAKQAHVVIANYKSGDDVKLGVDYATLSSMNPSLIYASVSGFGPDSPRTAYDLILQAESGFFSMNGETGGRGVKLPVALIDLLAGHQLKEAILLAMLKKQITGKGAHVHVSLFQSAVASLANQATNWLIGKQVPRPSGSLHPNIAPYGEVFDTKDKQQVTFAIGSNKQFKALCVLLEYGSLSSDPHFISNQQRVVNRQQLYALLYDRVKTLTFNEVYQHCIERDIPMGKIRDLREVFNMPEAREMLRSFQSEGMCLETVSGNAFRFL